MEKRSLSRFFSQDLRLVHNAPRTGWLALCGLLLFLRPIVAQTSHPETLQSRAVEIEHQLRPQFGPIRLHRIEDLEDDVFVPRLGSNDVESPFFLYEIQQRRFFLEGGEIHQNVTARALSHFIAISQDGRQTYYLAGFPGSEDNFRRLVSDYHLLVPRDRSDAESRALYCARVVFGVEPQQWVFEEEQALRLAADDFFQQGDKDAFSQANHWLRNLRNKNQKTSTKLTTIKNTDGSYLIRLPLFWAPVETRVTPEIRELQVQVSQDGSCHRITDSSSAEPKPR
jgi:hypothetical protein